MRCSLLAAAACPRRSTCRFLFVFIVDRSWSKKGINRSRWCGLLPFCSDASCSAAVFSMAMGGKGCGQMEGLDCSVSGRSCGTILRTAALTAVNGLDSGLVLVVVVCYCFGQWAGGGLGEQPTAKGAEQPRQGPYIRVARGLSPLCITLVTRP